MKIAGNKLLRTFIEQHLYDDQSPKAISGRIKRHEKHLAYVSKNGIYRYIASAHGRKIEYYRNKRKQRRWRRYTKHTKLTGRTFIDKRPKHIDKRYRLGDAEADFMASGKTGKGILLVVVDRKTRSSFLEQILFVTMKRIHTAFQRIKRRFPELITMTTDNDILFKKHEELEKLLGIKIYFCHPYHSWEKGTIENTNKHIRRDIPKSSNISSYSKSFIYKIEQKLNRRMMECLNFCTPSEELRRIRKNRKSRKANRYA